MLKIIVICLIGLGIFSMLTSYSLTSFIYALLIMSIFITLVGVICGRPNAQFSDKQG